MKRLENGFYAVLVVLNYLVLLGAHLGRDYHLGVLWHKLFYISLAFTVLYSFTLLVFLYNHKRILDTIRYAFYALSLIVALLIFVEF